MRKTTVSVHTTANLKKVVPLNDEMTPLVEIKKRSNNRKRTNIRLKLTYADYIREFKAIIDDDEHSEKLKLVVAENEETRLPNEESFHSSLFYQEYHRIRTQDINEFRG